MQFQNIKHQHTVKNQNEGKRRKVADASRNYRPGSQSQIEQAAPTLSSCKDTGSSKVLDHRHFSYSHCFSFVAIHQVASEVCEVHQNIELFLFSYSTHSRLLICFLKFLFVYFIRILILVHRTIKSSRQVETLSRVCTFSVSAANHLIESEHTYYNLKGQAAKENHCGMKPGSSHPVPGE